MRHSEDEHQDNSPSEPGVDDACFPSLMLRWLAQGAGAVALFVVLTGVVHVLIQDCGRSGPGPEVNTVLLGVGLSYERYLVHQERPFEFDSPKEFTTKLSGENQRKNNYLLIPPDWFNKKGQLIDNWGRPLRITQLDEVTISIRSAGRDGRFDTADDNGRTFPREEVIKEVAVREKKRREKHEMTQPAPNSNRDEA